MPCLSCKKHASQTILPDTSTLIATLNHFHPLSEDIQSYFKQHVYPSSFLKGELLLKAGDICNHIYFIKKGAVRGFIKEGDKDITTWITAENELVTSISGIFTRQPAAENMQAIEDCEMLTITYANLEIFILNFPNSTL